MEAHHRVQHFSLKWGVYFTGLFIMALGIVLTIKADFGASPWDVLHIGLFKQLGLTIGTWSIIVGFVILILSFLISKKRPQIGAFLNMLTVGVFIDMIMLLPFLQTPDHVSSKIIMLLVGIVINGYGMGLYISARCGAGPRDSLMIVLTDLIGWKVQYIRTSMEVIVLLVGWVMGGPVFVGTIVYCVSIGYVAGYAIPQCRKLTDSLAMRIGRPRYQQVEANHFSN